LARVPNAHKTGLKTKSVTALTATEVLWPVANTLVGELSTANDEATEVAAIGLLAVPSTWDPTIANAPLSSTTVTVPSSGLPSDNPMNLTAGSTYTLTNWDFYTLGQYELDDNGNVTTTVDPYYADGYNEEISWTVGTTSYWLDFSDDGTQVQVEVTSPDSTTTGAEDDFVVETNFNLSTQSFSFNVTNADGVSGTTNNFQLTYDNPTVGASGYLDADFEQIDTTGDSISSTILSGYFDAAGALVTGYTGDPQTDTSPTFIYETVDSTGSLVDQGTLTEANGVVATTSQTGTDDPSVTVASAADGSSNYYWNLLF
jgi:hypothetical protein